jgi:hypothetical protein
MTKLLEQVGTLEQTNENNVLGVPTCVPTSGLSVFQPENRGEMMNRSNVDGMTTGTQNPQIPDPLTDREMEAVIAGFVKGREQVTEDELYAVVDQVIELKLAGTLFKLLVDRQIRVAGLNASGELVFEATP